MKNETFGFVQTSEPTKRQKMSHAAKEVGGVGAHVFRHHGPAILSAVSKVVPTKAGKVLAVAAKGLEALPEETKDKALSHVENKIDVSAQKRNLSRSVGLQQLKTKIASAKISEQDVGKVMNVGKNFKNRKSNTGFNAA